MPSAEPSRPTLRARTLRTLAELSEVEADWRALQAHPWADFDYYRQHLATQAEFLRPHVLVLAREGRTVALVAASLRRERLAWKVGSFTFWRSRARVLWIGTGAVLGEDSPEVVAALRVELLEVLARGEADAAYAHQLESGAPLALALQDVPALARDRRVRPAAGWVLELAATYEEFFASRSKSVRRHVKRYAAALERELGGELAVVCYRAPDELERLVADSERVARLTYHRGMRVGFEDTPELRRFFAFALAAGWMRGYVLYARGAPIAFWHGLAYHGTFVTRDTGYDPSTAALRPGQYLLVKVIEGHIRTRDTQRFDYGVMELDYKKSFGTRRYERTSLYVFAGGARGLWLWSLRTLSGALDALARRLLGSRAREFARKLARFGRAPAATPVVRGEGDEGGAKE